MSAQNKKTEEEKILHRRECEDFLYEIIESKIILKRLPLTKQKNYKKEVRISRADYTFLQYGFIIRKWAMRNYKLTSNELDMFLYLYPLTIFSSKQFEVAKGEIGFYSMSLKDFEDRGFIVVWSKIKSKSFYVLSHKMTFLISRMHRMFLLEEPIPMSVKNVIKTSEKASDKKLMKLFEQFNKKIK